MGPFAEDSDYFEPSVKPFMVNLRVDELDGLLAKLRAEGIEILGAEGDERFGRFAWIIDPEGTKVELWESPGAT